MNNFTLEQFIHLSGFKLDSEVEYELGKADKLAEAISERLKKDELHLFYFAKITFSKSCSHRSWIS